MEYATHLLFAATESSDGSLLSALGIDLRLLILQTVAFLLLVAFLAKFVYPAMTRAIDNRQKVIDDSLKAAEAAKQTADQAESKVAAEMVEARRQAEDIIATAHKEAVAMIEAAEDKAKKRADHLVAEAREDIATETRKAADALRATTAELVSAATESVLGEKVDSAKDKQLIARSLQRHSEAK